MIILMANPKRAFSGIRADTTMANSCSPFLTYVCAVISVIEFHSAIQAEAQTTTSVGTTVSPGCSSINKINNAQARNESCRTTDNVLRIQCDHGACQSYQWSLNSCTEACRNGKSSGPSNSSSYVCSSNCQSAATLSSCNPPQAVTPYYCGTTTTSTTESSTRPTSTTSKIILSSISTMAGHSNTNPTSSRPTHTTSGLTTSGHAGSTSKTGGIVTATMVTSPKTTLTNITPSRATDTSNSRPSSAGGTTGTRLTSKPTVSGSTPIAPTSKPPLSSSASTKATSNTLHTTTWPTINVTFTMSGMAKSTTQIDMTLAHGSMSTTGVSRQQSTHTTITSRGTPPTNSPVSSASNAPISQRLSTTPTATSGPMITVPSSPANVTGPSAKTTERTMKTNCKGVTASMMTSTVQPAKNCSVCKGAGCSCASGYVGDGYDCAVDQCSTMSCKTNEYCQGHWSKSKCQFSVSFVCKCDPSNGCDTGCSSPVEVTNQPTKGAVSQKYNSTWSTLSTTVSAYLTSRVSTATGSWPSSTTTSTSTTSSATGARTSRLPPTKVTAKSCVVCHGPNCTCPEGYIGDGIDCAFDQCMSMTCAYNEYCQGMWYKDRNCQFSTWFSCHCDQDMGCGHNQTSPSSTTRPASTKQTVSTPVSSRSTATSSAWMTTSPSDVKEKCVNRTVVNALVRGGCGHNDNETRIQCSDGTCVPFETAYMNCQNDCPDGVDEQCPPGFVQCDDCMCSRPEEVTETCVNLTSAVKVSLCSAPVPSKNCTICKGTSCNCPDGYIGDGIDCAVDQCGETFRCASYEICQASWYKSADCQFTTSFTCYCDPQLECGNVSTAQTSSRPSVSSYVTMLHTVSTLAPTTSTSSTRVTTATTSTSTSSSTTSSTSSTSSTRSSTSSTSTSSTSTSTSTSSTRSTGSSTSSTSSTPTSSTSTSSTSPTTTSRPSSSTTTSTSSTTTSTTTSSSSSSPSTTISPSVSSNSSRTTSSVSRPPALSTTTTSSSTSTSTTTTPSQTSVTTASTTVQCRSILDAVVMGGCGYKDNVTRIQCGDGTCVPYDSAYMNCKRDCNDGIDEECMPGFAKCDGCTCVEPENINSVCADKNSVVMSNGCGTGPTVSIGSLSPTRPSAPASTATNGCTICHGANCTCPSGTIGDGINCVPDGCIGMTCAWNEYCQSNWYITADCKFTTAFRCMCDLSLGCGSTSASPAVSRQTRPPVTAPSACTVCHGENCTCPAGYIGDGINCTQDQCNSMKCNGKEICEAYWYKSETCQFKTSFNCVCEGGTNCNQTGTPAPEPVVCKVSEFLCRTGHRKCIPCGWVEDTIKDCDNGEDEAPRAAVRSNCAPPTAAPVTQYAASGVVTHGLTAPPGDPCATGRAQCPSQSTCVGNPNGTYSCLCNANYYYDNGQCSLHPCYDTSKPSPCDSHAWCDSGNSSILTSSYTCHCILPYVGDGKTCQFSTAPQPAACDNSTQWRCPSDGACIPVAWVLDHIRDCPNGDDEQEGLVDECAVHKNNCDKHALCTKIDNGGYNCTCQYPYYGNGFSCWLPRTQRSAV